MKDKKEKRMRPKTSLPPLSEDDTTLLENTGDRIAEGLSIGVPTQPLLKPTGLGSFFGKWVRLLLRDGSVITGFLQKRLFNFVHLLNIVEIGKDYKLSAPWCAIDLGSVARVYPAETKVEHTPKP